MVWLWLFFWSLYRDMVKWLVRLVKAIYKPSSLRRVGMLFWLLKAFEHRRAETKEASRIAAYIRMRKHGGDRGG